MNIKLFLLFTLTSSFCLSDDYEDSYFADSEEEYYLSDSEDEYYFSHNEQDICDVGETTNNKEITPVNTPVNKVSRVYAGGYGGFGTIDGAYHQDGQFGQFRLSLGCDAYSWDKVTIGVEGGIQSGNTMRLQMKIANRNLAGGLYPQMVLKPVIDLLATVRYNFISKYHLLLKGGAAYRQMQFTDRTSSKDDLRSVSGELQAGLGYQLTKHTRIVGLYQGIYAHARTKYQLSTGNYVQLRHIPLQQAGFLGVEYAF